jgi:hypothetical protein
MVPEIKVEWGAALLSGKYTQGAGSLERDGCHCVLGVLCACAVRAGIIRRTPQENGLVMFEHIEGLDGILGCRSSVYLPEPVAEWAKLPVIPTIKAFGVDLPLSGLNDRGVSYSDLWVLIEQQY